ncbi:MAG: hypothetical protein GX552_12060 [Chloroflexi bacterium]|nr:hypothetical protein [Chloroflexota bacterium]
MTAIIPILQEHKQGIETNQRPDGEADQPQYSYDDAQLAPPLTAPDQPAPSQDAQQGQHDDQHTQEQTETTQDQ